MDAAINRLREKIAFARLRLNWRWLQFMALFDRSCGRSNAKPSLVLVPCDPSSVIGSRGDEAMVYSIARDFRSRHPEGRIMIVTSRPSFAETADGQRLKVDLGVEFSCAWRPRLFLSNIIRAYKEARATEVYVLGADCMDGHWSVYTSLILLAAADLAARMGIATRLTGFSWNAHPSLKVVRAFRNVTQKLPILVRDPVSYERFKGDVRHGKGVKTAKLVADVAFNLQPYKTPMVRTELDWMNVQHAQGRFILGFNLHSMLVPKEKLKGFVDVVVAQLLKFMGSHPNVALVLVPHDYRVDGDLKVLEQVAAGLASEMSRVRLVTTVLSAEELKALAGGFDALFTSRMHLGIATLGMGKPIGAFMYQGKFIGLFRQFGLPETLVLSPEEADEVAEVLGVLLHEAEPLMASVANALPTIFADCKANLLFATEKEA